MVGLFYGERIVIMKFSLFAKIACLIGLTTVIVVALVLRQKEYVKVVQFMYSRTQEYKAVQDHDARCRFHDKSVCALRSLFDDWKFGSVVGSRPFYMVVRARFLASPEVASHSLSGSKADELIKSVRFEVGNCPPDEIPVPGQFVIRADEMDIANALAKVYMESMREFIEQENVAWAEKSAMDKGSAVQHQERELAKFRKRLLLSGLGGAEAEKINVAISDVEREMKRCKAEWDAAIKAYREKWDVSLVFLHEADASKCRNAADEKD